MCLPSFGLINNSSFGRKPCSSGYGRRLMFRRSWVWIPAPDGHFSHLFVVKIVIFVWKDEKIKKRDRGWPIFKNNSRFISRSIRHLHRFIGVRTKSYHLVQLEPIFLESHLSYATCYIHLTQFYYWTFYAMNTAVGCWLFTVQSR